MLPVDATVAQLLRNNYRNVIVEVMVQFGSPGQVQVSYPQNGQIMLDGILSIEIEKNDDFTAGMMNLEIASPDGRYSPNNVNGATYPRTFTNTPLQQSIGNW